MATYIIGDIHGCYLTLKRLLTRVEFTPGEDRLWLVGDLVNRGPRSLEVLQWCHDHRAFITAVLGNHDLHLMAELIGAVRSRRKNRALATLVQHADAPMLVDWVRSFPLLHEEDEHILVHAGLWVGWSLAEHRRRAARLEEQLRGERWAEWVELSFAERGPQPGMVDRDSEHPGPVLSVLTRMRALSRANYMLDHEFKEDLRRMPNALLPWFAVWPRTSTGSRVYFGHWAALGVRSGPGWQSLDSGCAWGGSLTALCLETGTLYAEPMSD
jgi:bis(5'-nucleosyl)-tetraphosphatase (symmetrical)